MSKRVTTFLAAAAAAALLLVAWTLAVASPAASAPAGAANRVVPIVMKDPGCHWFQVAGKNRARLTVYGATGFRNGDEAAVIFKGKNFLRRVPVGKTLFVSRQGIYRITMVGQHPDDNTLVLVVK